MESSTSSVPFTEGTPPPPPPPMFGSPVLDSFAGKVIEVCPPVAYSDNDYCTGHPECAESDCSDDVMNLKHPQGRDFSMICYCLG